MSGYTGGWWPTASHEDLLAAAVWPPDEALAALQRWKARPDSHDFDVGSYRLMPQVYHNLQAVLPDDPMRALLRGIYRREWLAANVLQRTAIPALSLLDEHGIDVLLLKGAALIASLPVGSVIRPMDDIDILVPASRLALVSQVLIADGFQPGIPGLHAQKFMHAERATIEVHTAPLKRALDHPPDPGIWRRARIGSLAGYKVRTGSPADQLVHACVHGIEWNAMAPIRWVCDASLIIRHLDLDWNDVLSRSDALRAHIPMLKALQFLRDQMHLDVPEYVTDALRSQRFSTEATLTFVAATMRRRPAAALLLPWRYSRYYQRWNAGMALREEKHGFRRFIVSTFGGRKTPGVRAVLRRIERHRNKSLRGDKPFSLP